MFSLGRRKQDSVIDDSPTVSIAEARALVHKYTTAMQTEESVEWCKCLWQIHPDDTECKPGTCRECGQKGGARDHLAVLQGVMMHAGNPHPFAGIRRRRVDDHLECPVHTKEGMITYFFEWVRQHD